MRKYWLIAGFYLLFAPSVKATQSSQFITVVNPVRISRYNSDPVVGLQTQYSIISQYQLPATWLLTYNVLNRPEIVAEFKKFSSNQELGIFLEITPEFSKIAGVKYHNTGSWHFANAVFLSGYTQEERIKFIDTVFTKFKEQFGYYPISVGAWWIDSFSLNYMHDKYGITANLGVADQYSTDNYQVWGTYWSTPYYPSKLHAGLPASSPDNKIGVVTLQWAPREPRRGYYSSLYSTQDYFTTPKLDINYFFQLIDQFSQVTVGLEGDFSPEAYRGEYTKQMQVVAQKTAAKVTMGEFAKWYKNRFPDVSSEQTIDFDGMIWYQSPFYRLGVDKTNKKIIDFRIYPTDYQEPYYLWPNREKDLRINIPSVIDSAQDPSEVWNITDVNIKTLSKYFESMNKPPQSFFRSKLIKISQINNNWRVEVNTETKNLKDGIVFSDWSLETKHLLKAPKSLIRAIITLDWDKLKKEKYWISPEEIIGLDKLRQLPAGKVLVYDYECLQCEYFGKYRPAAFANSRRYVSKFSQKPIVYNHSIFEAKARPTAKKQLQKTGAKYIYLVKYNQYPESLPFSPGDLGVEKIFENANVQIWIKKI